MVRGQAAITMIELVACTAVLAVLSVITVPVVFKVYESSAVAVSAENIRQLAAGGVQYLADNDHRFWNFREDNSSFTDADGNIVIGTRFWFGFETKASAAAGEGERNFDPSRSPLAGYVPRGIRPDPSFALHGSAFKPKYKSGYLGIGYNVLLAGSGWMSPNKEKPLPTVSYWQLDDPSHVIVFTTCAQVNDFQSPASSSNPMIEEFYGIDQLEKTVHFIYGKRALVSFADGSSGFLPMDESTRDNRVKDVNIGRFAPVGSLKYLK